MFLLVVILLFLFLVILLFVEFHLYKISKTVDPLENEDEAAELMTTSDGDLPFE